MTERTSPSTLWMLFTLNRLLCAMSPGEKLRLCAVANHRAAVVDNVVVRATGPADCDAVLAEKQFR